MPLKVIEQLQIVLNIGRVPSESPHIYYWYATVSPVVNYGCVAVGFNVFLRFEVI